MLQMNGIIIDQQQNEYHLLLPDGTHIAGFISPPDGQHNADTKLLENITKAFALRLGI